MPTRWPPGRLSGPTWSHWPWSCWPSTFSGCSSRVPPRSDRGCGRVLACGHRLTLPSNRRNRKQATGATTWGACGSCHSFARPHSHGCVRGKAITSDADVTDATLVLHRSLLGQEHEALSDGRRVRRAGPAGAGAPGCYSPKPRITAAIATGRSSATSPRPSASPARPCSHAPAQAASQGGMPPASSAAIRPASTSPAPAVARAGVPVPFDGGAAVGGGDHRVRPFQQHHGADLRGGGAGGGEAVGAGWAEQLGELALVRRDGRPRRGAPRGGRHGRPARPRRPAPDARRRATAAGRRAPRPGPARGRRPR